MASSSLPPLPELQRGPARNGSSAAFAGGLSGIQQSVAAIEAAGKQLIQQLPSLAPLVAEFIAKLRVALPSAVGAGAGQDQGSGAVPSPAAQNPLPSPPEQQG